MEKKGDLRDFDPAVVTVAGQLVLVLSAQYKLLIYFGFHAQPSLRLTEKIKKMIPLDASSHWRSLYYLKSSQTGFLERDTF